MHDNCGSKREYAAAAHAHTDACLARPSVHGDDALFFEHSDTVG